MKHIEETGKVIEVGKLLAGVIAASLMIGIATAGFGQLPDRIDRVEMAQGSMMTNIETLEDRVDAVERAQIDIKKELQLITCLQLAEAKELFYQDCLQ